MTAIETWDTIMPGVEAHDREMMLAWRRSITAAAQALIAARAIWPARRELLPPQGWDYARRAAVELTAAFEQLHLLAEEVGGSDFAQDFGRLSLEAIATWSDDRRPQNAPTTEDQG